MTPPTLPFLLLLLVFALLSPPSLSDDYLDCSPPDYRCGSAIYDIRYPFRLRGSPSYCGDPQLEDLYCSMYNDTLLTTISGTEYQVNQIDYTHHTLRITDVSVLDPTTDPSCPRPPPTNISLNSALFSYTVVDANLTIYLNCTPGLTVPSHLHNFSCSDMSFFYRLSGEPPPPVDVWDVCDSMVIVPVINRTVEASGFAAAITGGFGLTWKMNELNEEVCDKCMKSNGICGNNPGSGEAAVCLCSNATSINGSCVPLKESSCDFIARTDA